MPGGVTEGQVAAARSSDLLSYLQSHEPGSVRKSGPGEYCLAEHDSLKISNGKWFWFSRGFGSNNALDFLIQVRGMNFTEAVSVLADGRAAPAIPYSPPVPAALPAKKLFMLPFPNANSHRAVAYLMGRGIDRAVIGVCLRAGTLYESRNHHNCVFVGKDGEGKVRFACERGTSDGYKKDAAGSDKRYGFAIPAWDSTDLYVFEAPVDLLSLATLRCRQDPENWNGAHYLSLGGVSPRALEQYLTDHPGVARISLCLDNDPPGREAAAKIRSMLETKGYAVSDMPPPTGKDWNGHLQNTVREQAAHHRAKDAGISL